MNAWESQFAGEAEEKPAMSEMALVLASVADLMRSHREMLNSIRRIEQEIARLRLRLDEETWELPPEKVRKPPLLEPEALPNPARDPVSDESLLRAIEGALREATTPTSNG